MLLCFHIFTIIYLGQIPRVGIANSKVNAYVQAARSTVISSQSVFSPDINFFEEIKLRESFEICRTF